MKSSKSIILIPLIIVSTIAIAGPYIYITLNARAVLVNPRLGCPVRAPATSGVGDSGEKLDGSFPVWVGTDPADVPVPLAWLDAASWHVGLTFTLLDGAPLVEASIEAVTLDRNVFVSYGGGDTSVLSQNAIRMEVTLPASIQPGIYNLHVAFNVNLAMANFTVVPGQYQGETGTAHDIAGDGFLLSERSCVYVPWVNDSLASDPGPSGSGYYNPWSLVHITDIHFGADGDSRLQLPGSEVYTSALRDALSVLAPEVLIATGDLTRDPFDRDSEYRLAYDWFSSTGIPVIAANGNHDQGSIGYWPYYFGPQLAVLRWGGIKFVTFNSVLPTSGRTVSLIANEVKLSGDAGEPVFLACHIPLMDVFGRQTSGSAASIVDAMVRYNGTAVLQGHNHYNLVMDAKKALNQYLNFGVELETMDAACEFTTLDGSAMPAIDGPKLIITSTVGYGGRDSLQDAWPSYIPMTGYREVTMAGNRIANYTYDVDGDGSRDASYGQPVFDYTINQTFQNAMLNFSLQFDPANASAGAIYTIYNNLTEDIWGARAAITLPVNATHRWQAIGNPFQVYERVRVTNVTHEYVDFRLNMAKKSTVDVHLQLMAV